MGRIKSAIDRDIEESYILHFDRIKSYKSDHIDYFDKHFPCIEEDYSEEINKTSFELDLWKLIFIVVFSCFVFQKFGTGFELIVAVWVVSIIAVIVIPEI